MWKKCVTKIASCNNNTFITVLSCRGGLKGKAPFWGIFLHKKVNLVLYFLRREWVKCPLYEIVQSSNSQRPTFEECRENLNLKCVQFKGYHYRYIFTKVAENSNGVPPHKKKLKIIFPHDYIHDYQTFHLSQTGSIISNNRGSTVLVCINYYTYN